MPTLLSALGEWKSLAAVIVAKLLAASAASTVPCRCCCDRRHCVMPKVTIKRKRAGSVVLMTAGVLVNSVIRKLSYSVRWCLL